MAQVLVKEVLATLFNGKCFNNLSTDGSTAAVSHCGPHNDFPYCETKNCVIGKDARGFLIRLLS